MIDGVADFIFVLREVHFEASFHVEGLESNPVVRFKVRKKSVRPVLGILGEPAVCVSAELHQDHHRDWCIRRGKVSDRLRHAFVDNPEIFFLEARDDVAVLRGGDDIERDDRHVYRDGGPGLRRLLRGSRGLSRRILLRLRSSLRAGGSLSVHCVFGEWKDRRRRHSGEQD